MEKPTPRIKLRIWEDDADGASHFFSEVLAWQSLPAFCWGAFSSQPSHRKSKKTVGFCLRTCRTAGDENKSNKSNRLQTDRPAPTFQLQSFLPRFAIIDTAREADAKRARELCAGLKEGEIVIFDKGYVDYGHLGDLQTRGVIWVTRAKENMQCEVVEKLPIKAEGKIVADELVALKTVASQQAYPEVMRRVTAWVEADGKERLMTFLTNQLAWSPETIAELYRCRWGIANTN